MLTPEQQESKDAVLAGNRRAMARLITQLESTLPEEYRKGRELLETVLPHTGNSTRIAVSGVPGVGKSTFIESFGLHLISKGHQVAVLAIDPSSSLSGGSILGDKTRMHELSRHPQAYIRPSPTSGFLGGVARKTRETMLVCEAAGFDTILVETVGVGQSEIQAASMVDLFVLLLLPNAGDELQGIKKGILEMADLVLINKADGHLKKDAEKTLRDFQGAKNYTIEAQNLGSPDFLCCSALSREGLVEVYERIFKKRELLHKNGHWIEKRQNQQKQWLRMLVDEELQQRFHHQPGIQEKIEILEEEIISQNKLPSICAENLLDDWFTNNKG